MDVSFSQASVSPCATLSGTNPGGLSGLSFGSVAPRSNMSK